MSARKGAAARWVAIAAAVIALFAVTAPAASANLRNVTGGESRLVLNFQANLQLAQDNVYAFVIPPAQLDFFTGSVRFPITGGLVESSTMVGSVNHAGGLLIVKYNADQTVVEKQLETTDLKIVNGSSLIGNALGLVPTPTASLVNTTHSATSTGISYEGDAEVDALTATVLNVYFDTNVFTAGLRLGRLKSTIQTTTIL
jgi:hypothetical protein